MLDRSPARGENVPSPAEQDAPPRQGESVPAEPITRFEAFKYRNFRLLSLGTVFTSAAMWIQQTTLGWVVYDLTGSGSALGAMNAIRSLPTLLVTPLAGVTADRVSRNVIIAISQAALAILALLIAAAVVFDILALWHIFAFTFLAAVANSFNMPARQTMVFDVVPRRILPNAVALNNLGASMARTLGPMVGGALIAAMGAAANFSLQACAYIGVMFTVLLMRMPPREHKNRPLSRKVLLGDMAEGYSFVARTPQARLLMLMTVINPVFLIPLHLALLPIYAKTIFDGGAPELGIMLGSIGAGGIIGGFTTASLNSVDRRGLMQLFGLFVHSLSHAAFAFIGYVTGEMWVALPFLVIAGAAEALHMTTNQTVLQLLAPDHLRGRISSVLQFSPLLMSLGVATGGVLADVFSAQAVGITLSLLAVVVVVLIYVFSPRMRNLRLSELNSGLP